MGKPILPHAKLRTQPRDPFRVMANYAKSLTTIFDLPVPGVDQGDLVLPEQFIHVQDLSPVR
jgi:hypothetical protein